MNTVQTYFRYMYLHLELVWMTSSVSCWTWIGTTTWVSRRILEAQCKVLPLNLYRSATCEYSLSNVKTVSWRITSYEGFEFKVVKRVLLCVRHGASNAILSLVWYLNKFLSHLSDVTKPLRLLTKEDMVWTWVLYSSKLDPETSRMLYQAHLPYFVTT